MILVVDDNKYAAQALGKMLQLDGYPVEIAYDGETAIAMAENRSPDAVILDISLPGMNGYEVARAFREQLKSTALLIALTGYYGRKEDKQEAARAGFDHHLTKPVLVADIEKIINALRPRI